MNLYTGRVSSEPWPSLNAIQKTLRQGPTNDWPNKLYNLRDGNHNLHKPKTWRLSISSKSRAIMMQQNAQVCIYDEQTID